LYHATSFKILLSTPSTRAPDSVELVIKGNLSLKMLNESSAPGPYSAPEVRIHIYIYIYIYIYIITPWSESVNELYRPSDHRLSTK
jgi:hypothetical protein